MSAWSPEQIAIAKEMCGADCGDDWQTAAIAFRRALSAALIEIERLQARLQSAQEAALKLGESINATVARDQRREQLLRDAVAEIAALEGQAAMPEPPSVVAARIRAELEGKP